jgi:hypothetical protein
MSEQPAPGVPKPAKGRSPSYPGIPLETAIDRARTMYEVARHQPIPLATVTAKWGYKQPTTGPASVTYAALKKYGLISDEGAGTARMAQLTELAIKILHANPERDIAIRQAALAPPIMREWWDRYGIQDLPHDDTLRWEYVIQGPFTENGLADFLRVYRANIVFAKLTPSDRVDGETPSSKGGEDDQTNESMDGSDREDPPPPPPKHRRTDSGVLTIPVPMQDSDPVIVEFPGKLTEDDWEYFLTTIATLKRGVVRKSGDSASSSTADD